MSEESIIAKLGFDNSNFKKGLTETVQTTTETVNKLNETLEGLQKGFAAGAIGEFTNKVLENAEAIEHQSKNLGVGTDALQALQFAAREAGGTTEEATRVFSSAKLKLDELRAGGQGAVESFGKLGLSAADFVGLDLDQALAKIAHAYAENADRAGVYSGLQEITGRTGKQLTEVLKELGEEGFGTLIAKAKDAHAVIEGQTLSDLAAAKNEFDHLKEVLMTGSSEMLGALAKGMEGLGSFAGAAVGKIETATGAWGKLKAVVEVLAAATNPAAAGMLVVEQSVTVIAQKSDDTAKSLESQKEALRVSSAVQELRVKYEEAIAKAAREGLDDQTKINFLREEIAKHLDAAAKAGSDEVTMQKEINAAATLEGEVRKLVNDQHQKALDSQIKQLETGRQQLPLMQQEQVIRHEIALIEADIAANKKAHLDISKDQTMLDTAANALAATRVKLAEEELKNAADLLSADQQKRANAEVYFELLNKQITSADVLQKTHELLARGVQNLSDQEKIILEALVNQLTPLQKQQEVADILGKKITSTLTPAEAERMAVLTGQEANLKSQIDLKGSLAKAAGVQAGAEKGVTSEFAKQLALIEQMAGLKSVGSDPTKPGGEKTITVGELQQAADQAKNAFEYAKNHTDFNDPQAYKDYQAAQALAEKTAANLDYAKVNAATLGGYNAVPINQLPSNQNSGVSGPPGSFSLGGFTLGTTPTNSNIDPSLISTSNNPVGSPGHPIDYTEDQQPIGSSLQPRDGVDTSPDTVTPTPVVIVDDTSRGGSSVDGSSRSTRAVRAVSSGEGQRASGPTSDPLAEATAADAAARATAIEANTTASAASLKYIAAAIVAIGGSYDDSLSPAANIFLYQKSAAAAGKSTSALDALATAAQLAAQKSVASALAASQADAARRTAQEHQDALTAATAKAANDAALAAQQSISRQFVEGNLNLNQHLFGSPENQAAQTAHLAELNKTMTQLLFGLRQTGVVGP